MNTLLIGLVVLVLIVLVVLAVFVVLAKRKLAASEGNSAAVREKIKQGATTIDIRTPAEYESGHYGGAKNIPLQELKERLAEVGDKNKAIVVYCASGMRSAQAAKILTEAGFTDVTIAGMLKKLEQYKVPR